MRAWDCTFKSKNTEFLPAWTCKGGEASSWDYGQKLKKHLKHFFSKFQFSTIYRFWDISFQSWEISPTVLPAEFQVSRNLDKLFKF